MRSTTHKLRRFLTANTNAWRWTRSCGRLRPRQAPVVNACVCTSHQLRSGGLVVSLSTDSHSPTGQHDRNHRRAGEQYYQRALDAFEAARLERKGKEEKRSAEQFEAWKRAQERSRDEKPSANEGIAVVRTIAKQVRRERDIDDSKENALLEEAQSLLEKAAYDCSHPQALVHLGNKALEDAKISADPLDVQQNVQKAIEFYDSAGRAGSAAAYFNLGHLYWTGYPSEEDTQEAKSVLGVDRDAAMASFQEAIDLGDADSMYFKSVHMLSDDTRDDAQGDTGERGDRVQSGLALVTKAASLGHGGAMYYLALLHYNGNDSLGIDPCSPQEFVKRLDAAAEAGDSDALFLRGHCFYHGEDGYSQSYPDALAAFLAASDAGNSDAGVSAGAMFHQGIGVAQDQSRAFELYQSAGERGNLEGWRNVVACYALGEGVPQCQKTAKYIAKTMLKEDE